MKGLDLEMPLNGSDPILLYYRYLSGLSQLTL